jgi:Ca2+-binding RTX toxin-like protein
MLGGDEYNPWYWAYDYDYKQYYPYFYSKTGDLMSGGRARDSMEGQSGFDTMYGDQCADTMTGGEHYDLMFGGNGHDLMYGDDAQDNDTGDALGPYVAGYEGNCDYRLGYSGNGDSMFGGYGEDTMYGGIGDDLMRGNAGDDVMYGEEDDDLMTGNRGDDFMSGGEGADDMSGGSGNDTMEGNEGDDNMFGDTGDDVMSGGDGEDQMHGGEGDDLMAGNAGNDSMSGDDGDDLMNGNAGDDCMDGGAGRDVVNGNEGNDRLDGGAGIDTVSGGDGDDVIYTSDGTWTDYEVLNGGAGNDTFVYNAVFDETNNTATGTDGYTFIEDFTAFEDTLQLCISGNFSLECDFGEPGQPNLDAWDIINRQLMDALGDTNATGQHAVRVYDNGTDTLILFDDTLPTGQDASDPEHDLDETIWLKGVTGTANGGNEFASLDDMLNAGYNIEIRAELPDELAEWQGYYDSEFVPCSLDCECDYGNPFEDNEIPGIDS